MRELNWVMMIEKKGIGLSIKMSLSTRKEEFVMKRRLALVICLLITSGLEKM